MDNRAEFRYCFIVVTLSGMQMTLSGIVLGAVLIHTAGAELEPLLDPDDLPPAPTAAPPSILTHSQMQMHQLQGGIELTPGSTEPEEQSLVKGMAELREKLADAEERAYRDDPALRLCDLYVEKAHEWVMENHGAEFSASLEWSRSAAPEDAKPRQAKWFEMVRLIDMGLFKELAGNPNFAPLFEAAFNSVELLRKRKPKAMPGLYEYDRNDKLIGYSTESPPVAVGSLQEYLAELGKRHPRLLAKLAELRNAIAIPKEVFDGLKFGELYRLLDGAAQMVVEIRTPEEVRDRRQGLRRMAIQLANLRWKLKHEPARQ